MSVAVDEETFWLGDWKVEPTLNRIVRGEEIVRIDPRNMKVLQLLASKPGEVFSQAEIEESVWSDVIVTPNSVYQSIAQLRRALGDEKDNPKYIETIARKGYRIATVVTKQTLTNATLGKESSVAIARKGKSALFLFLAIATMATLSNYSHRLSVRTESLASASQSHSIPEPPLTLGELPKAANLQPRLLVELATVALADGKSREARDYLTKALEMERRRVGDNHPAIAEILRELAMAHVWESNYDAAESAAYGALDAVAGYPESHHEHIDSTLRLGYVLLERGKYESSEAYLRRALDLSMEVLGEKSRTTTEAFILLGALRLSQDRAVEAEQLVRQGIAIAEQKNAATDTVGYYKSILAAALIRQSHYQEAHEICKEVLSSLEDGLRANHPQVVAIRDLLGKSLLGEQQFAAAETIFRENIKLWQQNDGWNARAAGSASALGEALIGQGRLAEAAEYLARASLDIDGTQEARDARARFREHQARLDGLRLANILEADGIRSRDYSSSKGTRASLEANNGL